MSKFSVLLKPTNSKLILKTPIRNNLRSKRALSFVEKYRYRLGVQSLLNLLKTVYDLKENIPCTSPLDTSLIPKTKDNLSFQYGFQAKTWSKQVVKRHRGLCRTSSSICDEDFCENSSLLLTVNYFRKKIPS